MCFGLRVRSLKWLFGVLSLTALCACDNVLNAPRNIDDFSTNTLYSSFSGRSPKTLDPQVSYSSDETRYTYEIYEPLYQYHYLKRPYTITPRTAAVRVPAGRIDDAPAYKMARRYSAFWDGDYPEEIRLKRGRSSRCSAGSLIRRRILPTSRRGSSSRRRSTASST